MLTCDRSYSGGEDDNEESGLPYLLPRSSAQRGNIESNRCKDTGLDSCSLQIFMSTVYFTTRYSLAQ